MDKVFKNRNDLRLWLSSVSCLEAKNYCQQFLIERQKAKHLKYAPTQVELRSLMTPGMKTYMDLFGDYYSLCKNIGLEVKFNQVKLGTLSNFKPTHYIICDSREQKPLDFSIPTRKEGLNFGDYVLNDETFSHNVVIERKSMSDLYGTMTSGLDRFRRELDRARDAKAYVVILIEEDLVNVYSFPIFLRKTGKCNISSEYVFRNIRQLIQDYPNVQFLFVKNRYNASRAIETIFRCNGQFSHIDLQYLYDTKQLI